MEEVFRPDREYAALEPKLKQQQNAVSDSILASLAFIESTQRSQVFETEYRGVIRTLAF